MDIDDGRPTGPIKAVLADLAGTTVDFGSCAPAVTFTDLFAKRGIPVTAKQVRGPMGIHKRDHIAALLAMPGITRQWERVYGRRWTDEDLDVLYQDFVPMQIEALSRHSRVIAGVPEAVADLRRRGIRIGVSTGYNREMLSVILEEAAEGLFAPEASICATDVPEGRPSPWMNFRLMEQLNAYPPTSVVCVGDTVADIQAGLNACVWTVGVTRTGNLIGLSEAEWDRLCRDEQDERLDRAETQLKAAGAHYVIDSFSRLPAVITQLEKELKHGQAPSIPCAG